MILKKENFTTSLDILLLTAAWEAVETLMKIREQITGSFILKAEMQRIFSEIFSGICSEADFKKVDLQDRDLKTILEMEDFTEKITRKKVLI